MNRLNLHASLQASFDRAHQRLQFILLALLVSLFFSGCASVSYYSQSILGHSALMQKRQPIESVLTTQNDPELVRQLELSQAVLAFAEQELALPKTKSYRTYVQLSNEFPVWNVVAAPEFSLQPTQWCYLVIGCAAYRGYLRQARAEKYAAGLAANGQDTFVGGAIAYSTLGWFRDPLLSSMFRYGDIYLIETLIHELAHQKLYINGWSALNEGFASLVAQEGVERWLKRQQGDDLNRYLARLNAAADFDQLIIELKRTLTDTYAQTISDGAKRSAKKEAFDRFRQQYERIKKERWQGKGWYDNWLRRPLNNARLAAYSTYQALLPKLRSLLVTCEYDFVRFYATLEQLNETPKGKQDKREVPTTCI